MPRHSPHTAEHRSPCFRHVHLFVLQCFLQLHLKSSSSSGGADCWSVCSGRHFPAIICHPHSSGVRSSPSPFQSITCLYTRRLWYFAAAAVGGKTCGWTCAVLFDNLSQKRLYLSLSSPSPTSPPYKHMRAFSPARSRFFFSTLPVSLNTWACSRNRWLLCMFFNARPLPRPKTLDVVSQPNTACTNNI